MKIKIEAVMEVDNQENLDKILEILRDADIENIFTYEIYNNSSNRYLDSIFVTKSEI